MGKKRIVKKAGGDTEGVARGATSSKKHLTEGTLHIQSTYNNTKLTLTDKRGGAIASSSSGALGFKGAQKGTPFAAAKVGELIGERGVAMGLREVDVIIKGVGAGRESSLRGFIGKASR